MNNKHLFDMIWFDLFDLKHTETVTLRYGAFTFSNNENITISYPLLEVHPLFVN